MAKFNGANLRYNNSDDENRVYDLSAEVVVNDNKVEAVNSITAIKDGRHIGGGNINGLDSDSSYSDASFNFNGISVAESKVLMTAMIDFAQSCIAVAETSEERVESLTLAQL